MTVLDFNTIELADEVRRDPLTADVLIAPMRALAFARQAKALADEVMKAKLAGFQTHNADAIAAQKLANADLAAVEASVRDLVARVHQDTQEKKPIVGVEVKEYDVITISDPVGAFAWAKEKSLCVIPERLDEVALLKMAAATALPFCAYTKEPRVTLSSKLDPAAYVVPAHSPELRSGSSEV